MSPDVVRPIFGPVAGIPAEEAVMDRRTFGPTVAAGLALAAAGCATEPTSPLGRAAVRDDLAEVRRLIASGADVNAREGPGGTPLIVAARRGNASIIAELLRAGADPDLRDTRRTRWTPLMHAIHKRRREAARALLEGGADVDARAGGGTSTPLMMAAAYGDAATVRLLLAHGADPRARTGDGITALSNAAGGGRLFDITDGPPWGACHVEVVKALLEKAPDLQIGSGPAARLSRWMAWGRGCEEVRALLAADGSAPRTVRR